MYVDVKHKVSQIKKQFRVSTEDAKLIARQQLKKQYEMNLFTKQEIKDILERLERV